MKTLPGSLPIPLRWLRLVWVILMGFMVITLLLGTWINIDYHINISVPTYYHITLLYYAVIGIVTLLLIFVMVASSIIFWKAERQISGVLLALAILCYWTTDSTPFDILTQPEITPLYVYFRMPILIIRAAALLLALALLFTFPDGRFAPRWSRWLVLGYSFLTLLYLLIPELPTNTIYGATWRQTSELSFIVATIPFFIGMYAQVRRYRAATPETRNQLKWTVLGMVIMVIGVMLYYGVYAFFSAPATEDDPYLIVTLEAIRQFIQLVLAVILPVMCFMIAIFRYQLWSADSIINRMLVYTAFIGIISFIYFVSIVVVGLFVSTLNFAVSVPVTLFIVIIFQPLREQIQRTVDHLMFGDRANPYTLLTQMDTEVILTETTDRALAAIAEMLAQTLKVPCVSITMHYTELERSLTAMYGKDPEKLTPSHFPMTQGLTLIGEVILYQDAGDRLFSATERQLIEMVTRQTALIMNTIQLNTALQRSRQNIVIAREEERRRLRRDLHDGLGPTLAAHSLKVGKARTLIPQHPQTASEILSTLETDLAASLGEIRRLVEALPPARA
jgi:signal transduction histidine kinase